MTGTAGGDGKRKALRLAAVVLFAAAVAAVWFSPLRERLKIEHAREIGAMLAGSWFGPPLFILLFAVFAVLLVPATVFVVTGALVWGWETGGAYALVGASLGAILSYLLARWMGEGISRRLGPRGRLLAGRLHDSGFSALLILRLIPIFPFAMLNYAAGIAGLRPRDFVGATVIGLAPSIFIIAYSADALVLGTLSGSDAFGRLMLAGLLLAALAIVPALLRRRAGKAIHLEVDSSS